MKLPPVVHADDPAPAHEAAVETTTRAAQRALVLEAVRSHPGLTSTALMELVDGPQWSDDPHERLYQVRRRLSDLHKATPRHVYPAGRGQSHSGRAESRWWPASEPEQGVLW